MKFTITGMMVLLLALGSWSGSLHAQDIYKTVDENGNPVYTDRPPTPQSKPLSLRELSVVEVPEYAERSAPSRTAQDEDTGEMSLNELRRTYRNFKMVSPAPEQNIWGTANTATLAWDAGTRLLPGHAVIFYLDNEAVTEKTRNATHATGRLDRGEHVTRADLLDENNRVIASTDPVVFFIMQQQAQPVNRAGPAGG